MASSPIVARWELSRRLTALRKEKDIDVQTIADHLGFTRNYWSAIENNRTLIAEDKLRPLFDLLDVDQAERQELTDLREEGRKRGWWREHSVLDDDLQWLCGLEAAARSIRNYDGQYIPGLLQTEAYARAVISSNPAISPVNVDELVEIRLRRQLILHTDPPVDFQVLISEAVLVQEFADPHIQSLQLSHVADLAEQFDHIHIRLLPFSSNPGIILSASTLLFMDFGRDPHLPTISWHESLTSSGRIHSDLPSFRRLELAWEEGYRHSHSEEDTIATLRTQAKAFLGP